MKQSSDRQFSFIERSEESLLTECYAVLVNVGSFVANYLAPYQITSFVGMTDGVRNILLIFAVLPYFVTTVH